MPIDPWVFGWQALAACGTLFAGVVALFVAFKEFWLPLILRPKFDLIFRNEPPFLDLTFNPLLKCEYHNWRIEIWNTGRVAAKNVEVIVQSIYEENNQVWEKRQQFPPSNLKWSYDGGAQRQAIARGTSAMCDLGEIPDPTIFNEEKGLETEASLFKVCSLHDFQNRSHLLFPGVYRLGITVIAENAGPQKFFLELKTTGKSHHDFFFGNFADGKRVEPSWKQIAEEASVSAINPLGFSQ